MLLLGHICGVLKDVLIKVLFLNFYCRNVTNFFYFPDHALISVKVLCINKICNSVC